MELAEQYRGQGASTSIKGPWIRQFLLENPRTSVTSTFNAWKRFCEEAKLQGVNIRVGSYNSTKMYLYKLRKLGLVIRERVPHPTKFWPYSLYSVVPGNLNHPGWLNPARY